MTDIVGGMIAQVQFLLAHNQLVLLAGSTDLREGFKEIKEGKATILIENSNNVFYNNVQEFNRDIT